MIEQGIRPNGPMQFNPGAGNARRWGILTVAVLASGVAAAPARAELKYDVGVTSSYQYNTNVFDLPAGYALVGGDSQRDDWYYTYGAQVNLDYLWSEQDLFFKGTDTDFQYNHFTELTHNEYTLDGGWKWKLGSEFDGTLEVLRNSTMTAFADVNQFTQSSLTLSVQTDQREQGSIRWHFAPDWRVGLSAYTHQEKEPQDGAPNLQLKESQGAATVEFLGVAHLTAGLTGDYLSGSYSGATGFFIGGNYHETDEDMVATYQLTGESTFDMKAGYSERSSAAAADSIDGFTGQLELRDQITGKTTLTARISRAIQSYVANTGSEIDDTAHVDVAWQVTYKTAFTLGYEYSYRDLPDQGITPGTDRLDHVQYTTVGVDYEPRDWISVRPYANFQTRHSNTYYAQFSGNVYGVNLLLHMKDF